MLVFTFGVDLFFVTLPRAPGVLTRLEASLNGSLTGVFGVFVAAVAADDDVIGEDLDVEVMASARSYFLK